MPIVPDFTLEQSSTHVTLFIQVPHVRVSNDSLHVALSSSSGHPQDDEDSGDDSSTQDASHSSRLNVVHFASPPYLLVLTFAEDQTFHPSQNEESDVQLEVKDDHPVVRLNLSKAKEGLWKDLDLLGRLVMPSQCTSVKRTASSSSSSRWLHEVVEEKETAETTDQPTEAQPLHQETQERSTYPTTCTRLDGYGFLRMFHDIFTLLNKDDSFANELLELPFDEQELTDAVTSAGKDTQLQLLKVHDGSNGSDNAVNTYWRQRHKERIQLENETFSAERYFGDFDLEDDYVYECTMSMRPHWRQPPQTSTASGIQALEQQVSALSLAAANPDDDSDEALEQRVSAMSLADGQHQTTTGDVDESYSYFTKEERLQLLSIPYPLLPDPSFSSPFSAAAVDWGLLDLLFAYVYDHLTTMGDPTVESAWTVTMLSASLSCLEDWQMAVEQAVVPTSTGADSTESSAATTSDVIKSSLRRSLVYPYLRNVDLSLFAWKQVAQILLNDASGGSVRCVLRCLLQLRAILHKSDVYYLGNKLFVDPLLAWIQQEPTRSIDIGTECSLSARWKRLGKGILDTASAITSSEERRDRFKEELGLNLLQLEKEYLGYAEDVEADEDQSASSSSESDSSSDETSSSSEESDSDSSGDGDSSCDGEDSVAERTASTTAHSSAEDDGTDIDQLVDKGEHEK